MGIAIGLDFGTTNSIVTYNAEGKLKTFKQNGSPLIPSVLYFASRGEYTIGTTALALSEKNLDGRVSGFKIKLNDATYKYDEVVLEDGTILKLRPKTAVKLFLNRLIGQVQEYLIKKFGVEKGNIDRAVITVPAKFNDNAVRAIKSAAESAMNLQAGQIKLVYEPTAAAVASQTDINSEESKFLIYDFGGGTFDVSLIKREENIFKQINTDGDPDCGGDLLTEVLAKHFLTLANNEFSVNLPWDILDFDEQIHGIDELSYKKNRFAILKEADRIKNILSEVESFTANFIFYTSDGNSNECIFDITRAEFEDLIREKIEHTVEITRRVVESDAAEDVGGVDEIILAGGSSQIPLIRKILESQLGYLRINYSDDVSTLISRGAAILAGDIESLESLTSHKTTFQLGVASTDGVQYNTFRTVISEDTPLPCEASCDFSLFEDNQQHLEIAYYERDIKNYPTAMRVDDEGIKQIDVIQIDLPEGLKKSDTFIKINFKIHSDFNLELSAKVMLIDGTTLGEGKLKIGKASDLF